jgi:serine/threonine protein kinase
MTPDYASPEQILGLSLTTATDIYSLGVVLYEVITGERRRSCAMSSACPCGPPKSIVQGKPCVESRKGAWPGPTGSRLFPFAE